MTEPSLSALDLASEIRRGAKIRLINVKYRNPNSQNGSAKPIVSFSETLEEISLA